MKAFLALLAARFFFMKLCSATPNFPKDFHFGAATAAYQVEGAWNEGGRGPSVWDTFSQKSPKCSAPTCPEHCCHNETGNVADDQYHRIYEDVKLLKELGVDFYRFSMSWSRLLPTGRGEELNPEGAAYYHGLLDHLERDGIQPFVTMFHWDTPEALDVEYGSWLDRRIVEDFRAYAEKLYIEFGHRVKHWLTINEPWTVSIMGYGVGVHAPGRCSNRTFCDTGDSYTEPYTTTHHMLLAHAAASQTYREKYQASQQGQIGIVLNMEWNLPMTDNIEDLILAERRHEWQYGWHADPLVFGEYPPSMVEMLGDRLPTMTREDSELIKGSADFLGLNYYTTYYVTTHEYAMENMPYETTEGYFPFWDCGSISYGTIGWVPIGPRAESSWLFVYPPGIEYALLWIDARYGGMPVYVTENGVDVPRENDLTAFEAQNDPFRIDYYKEHIAHVGKAIEGGANVKGYFAWSLLDNFEWADGYTKRFGLVFVDYDDEQKRYPKASFHFYKNLIATVKSASWANEYPDMANIMLGDTDGENYQLEENIAEGHPTVVREDGARPERNRESNTSKTGFGSLLFSPYGGMLMLTSIMVVALVNWRRRQVFHASSDASGLVCQEIPTQGAAIYATKIMEMTQSAPPSQYTHPTNIPYQYGHGYPQNVASSGDA